MNDTLYSLARLPSHLFALKPGRHTLGPAKISVRVVDSQSGFGFPGIFQRAQTFAVSTPSLTLEVKPLPPGEPPSFTGGVGRFDLEMTLSTQSVAVGDPISVAFEVKGIGNLGTMGAPRFTGAGSGVWRAYEPTKNIDPEEESDGETAGRATFEQVIIPLEKTGEIPSFELAFFDPSSEEYVVRKTDPAPIEVLPDAGAARTAALPAGPAGGPAQGSSATPAATPVPRFDALLHIHPGPAQLRPVASAAPGPGFGFLGTQVLLSLGFCTLAGFGVARMVSERRKAKAHEQASPSFRQAVREVPGPGAPRGLYYRSVSRALEIWKKEHGDAPPKALEVIGRLTEKCGSHLYSGRGKTDEPVTGEEVQEVRDVLALLSRKTSR